MVEKYNSDVELILKLLKDLNIKSFSVKIKYMLDLLNTMVMD